MTRRAPKPTPRDFDDLLRFRPYFVAAVGQDLAQWSEPIADPNTAAITPAYPSYPAPMGEFVRAASAPCWTDFRYQPQAAGRQLSDDRAVATATLAEVRSMLTYVVRGERFCDGHWDGLTRRGRIAALLERVAALRPESAGEPDHTE